MAASELGPGAGTSEHGAALRAGSQIATALRVSGREPCWFSKLGLLGARLSGAGPKR